MGSKYRPVIGGISSGNLQTGATGTVGGRVFDVSTGEKLLLGNAHVFEATGNIIQPGRLDGGGNNDLIGNVIRSSKLKVSEEVTIDAAVAKPISADIVGDEIKDIGEIQGVVQPELGMKVFKSGRTTQLTEAVISDINAALTVTYPQGKIALSDLIFFKGPEPTVMGGDSGSLLVTYIDGKPYSVGLVFAGPGSEPYNYGVACKIENVMNELGVVFSTEEMATINENGTKPVQLSGIITDIETLIGIPNVRVIVDGYEDYTDLIGSYSIGIDNPGEYVVKIRVKGYNGGDVTAELVLGENNLSFALTKRDEMSLSTFIPVIIGLTAGGITIVTNVLGEPSNA